MNDRTLQISLGKNCRGKSTINGQFTAILRFTFSQKNQETSFCLHYQHSGAFLPDLQALRRKAKAKESAALEPTLAKPSTPLLTGRELGEKQKRLPDG